MQWNQLNDLAQLDQIKENSKEQAIGIFKHSTRCPISTTALDRLERNWAKLETEPSIQLYYLDLISFREISNAIAEKFGVKHESPQFLLIKNGEVVYHESHYGIDLNEIIENI